MSYSVHTATRSVSLEFFERMCRFMQSQKQSELSKGWQILTELCHVEVEKLAREGRALDLAIHFTTLFRRLDIGGVDLPPNFTDDQLRDYTLKQIRLAGIFLGELPVPNPEQPLEITPNYERILDSLEKAFKAPLSTEGCGNSRYVQIGERKIHARLIEFAVMSLLVGDYWWDPNETVDEILEIGSGSGWLAVAFGLKAKRPLSYYMIDLPVVSLFAAYQLAAQFGENAVWFSGEDISLKPTEIYFYILGNTQLPHLFVLDLVINSNSLPELPWHAASRLLNEACAALRIGGSFASFNHESTIEGQHRVIDLMAEVPCMEQTERLLYWMRVGYVQEIWQKL